MSKNNSELWNFVSRAAELNFFLFFLVFTFVWNYFSGQDEVRTSNLFVASVMGLSGLMLQLSHLAD